MEKKIEENPNPTKRKEGGKGRWRAGSQAESFHPRVRREMQERSTWGAAPAVPPGLLQRVPHAAAAAHAHCPRGGAASGTALPQLHLIAFQRAILKKNRPSDAF